MLELPRLCGMDIPKRLDDTCGDLDPFRYTTELIFMNRSVSLFPHDFACNFSKCAREVLIITRYSNLILPMRMEVTCKRNKFSIDQHKLLSVSLMCPQQQNATLLSFSPQCAWSILNTKYLEVMLIDLSDLYGKWLGQIDFIAENTC